MEASAKPMNSEQEFLQREICSLKMELASSQKKQQLLWEKNQKAERQLRNMQAIFAANQREPLDKIVDDFISDGRIVLKKISSQIHILEYDEENVATMQKLIDYLNHITNALETIKRQYQ